MSQQKFEKQVRQAMNEFSLLPSTPVWDKIAAGIRRKKERRRIVFWLLPLALLSSGITWWSLSTNEISSDTSQKPETNNQNIHKKTTTNSNKIPIRGKGNRLVKAPSNKHETGSNEESVTKSFKKTTFPSHTNAAKPKTKNAENKTVSNALHPTKKVKQKKLFAAHATVSRKEKLQEDQAKNETATISNLLNQSKDLVTPQQTDTIQEVKEPGQKRADAAGVSAQIDLQKPQYKKTKKLKFGAIVQIGFSGITTGLFDGLGQKSFQDFASPNSFQPGAGGVVNLPPSNIRRGFSYSLGITARKRIGFRSAISSGLQYQYYSTRINVGTKSDSVNNFSRAASYYRNDNLSKNYTNQFHFITLPFSYEYQLFKKLPLHINAGLSLSQLISSNALHYNSVANIYYRDNNLLNKTQAGLFTNLTYRLWWQKKFSLNVGPQFNYSLTALKKNSHSNKQHLFFMGLNTQVSF